MIERFVRAADALLAGIEWLSSKVKRKPPPAPSSAPLTWRDASIQRDASHVPDAHKVPPLCPYCLPLCRAIWRDERWVCDRCGRDAAIHLTPEQRAALHTTLSPELREQVTRALPRPLPPKRRDRQ